MISTTAWFNLKTSLTKPQKKKSDEVTSNAFLGDVIFKKFVFAFRAALSLAKNRASK